MAKKISNLVANEVSKCMLCYDAPCSKACPKGLNPAELIKSLYFDNTYGKENYPTQSICAGCDMDCQKACVCSSPPSIEKIISNAKLQKTQENKPSLEIDFCGIKCENPFFLSSSVVASNYEMCANALEMGWAGVVYKTIGFFKPEEVSPRFAVISKQSPSFLGFRNLEQISDYDLSYNLDVLKRLKENYPSKIIVASIMGQNEEEWTQLAKMVTDIGCDIIECNFSCPHMTGSGLGADVGTNPELVKAYTKAVRKATNIPILAKMTPNITNMEIPAMASIEAGADGIAAINTIKSITEIDLDDMSAAPSVAGKSSVSGYSGKAVKPIALRFIHDMKKHEGLKDIPISGMGGIETWKDASEFIALGCENIQITTAVMEYGYRIIDDLIDGLSSYLSEKGISKVSDLVGVALDNFVSTNDLNRSTVIFPKFDNEKCVGCGRCYISCMDAGHQAIEFDAVTRKPKLNGSKCVGCHLCKLVCQQEAIYDAKRIPKPKKS